MKRISILLIPLTFVAFILLIGAAVLLGRATPTTVVATDLIDYPSREHETFGLLDINRRHLIRSSVYIPGVRDSEFYGRMFRVLQRTERDEQMEWTFSVIDIRTGSLIPLMHLKTSPDERVREADFWSLDDISLPTRERPGRWQVYLEKSGQVWETDGHSIEARLAATYDPNLLYYHPMADGRVAAMREDGLTLMNADGSDRVDVSTLEIPDGWSHVSPDSKYIVTMTLGAADSNAKITLHSTADLSLVAEFTGVYPTWCGGRLIYFGMGESGRSTVHRVDLETGAEEATPLQNVPALLNSGYFLNSIDLMDEYCDWLETQPIPNEPKWVLHLPSGLFYDLGFGGQILEIDGDTLTYRTRESTMTQERRLVGGEAGSTLLAEYPTLGEDLIYIGEWRGLYVGISTLWLVDMAAGTQIELIRDDARGFSVLD